MTLFCSPLLRSLAWWWPRGTATPSPASKHAGDGHQRSRSGRIVWLCARNNAAADHAGHADHAGCACPHIWPARRILALYRFASLAEVRAWQVSYQSGGHQPWHLSPDITATAFAAFLGYTGVTQVAHSTVSGGDAHVAVGINLPNGTTSTSAIVHLLRFGSGKDAPWEVVGTQDTTFTLDRPAYGSTVASPVTAGGIITGVDENVRVTVHSSSAQGPIGTYCCRAVGETSSPWSVRVTFHATPGEVITIAASTGGHVATVERFAVTGVRAR